jgi:hypothetical protein
MGSGRVGRRGDLVEGGLYHETRPAFLLRLRPPRPQDHPVAATLRQGSHLVNSRRLPPTRTLSVLQCALDF